MLTRWRSSRGPWPTTRACIRLYAVPRIGHLPLQAVRPSPITKLYQDLLTSGGRDGQPLAVAAYTGARRGKLLNLRWGDIDLEGKKITITGSTAVISGGRVNGTT